MGVKTKTKECIFLEFLQDMPPYDASGHRPELSFRRCCPLIEQTRKTLGIQNSTNSKEIPPIWDISTLVAEGREALIRHDGQVYRLRITANRKLILTK